MKNNKAFTLIELLVVILIIGILTAIAVPQYHKAVLKADLHRGVALVESLYQAQQAYYLANGDYAWDIDELDVSFQKDSSCEKGNLTPTTSWYDCDYGRLYNHKKNGVQFQNKPNRNKISLAELAYVHVLEDNNGKIAGSRYCYAKKENKKAQDVCQEIGEKTDLESDKWIVYEIK